LALRKCEQHGRYSHIQKCEYHPTIYVLM